MQIQAAIVLIIVFFLLLAYGVPVGGDLEYADEVTLSRAIEGRSLI